ncbi:unnamed protein product [Gongylonema pulchrum]|uniref:Protein O-GlcNAcase-like n=1 Tax=Gongylonema pulchrum TaxID=637853 RepID=A0A183CV31_9BILA|nr:unnamed protein product [Gongylonema pulchrum]
MKRLGMNTYIYAPKDDLKHRAEWRKLYNSEETELLQSLIQTAKAENITFVYALSPGIDIVYSSEKEIKALHDKSEQVRCLGCDAFALLFDDIDAVLNDADKKQFSSIVMAQLTVANNLYESLKCRHFFFCPTGPRVVSRDITVDHVRRVAAVLQRKPVIWDNLHANDYDPKRVFLGPFAGRSVQLKEEISGMLLNPNCRYEANFLPFYTLAEWNSCHADAEIKEEEESDAILEAGDIVPVAVRIVENASPKRLYHPLKALDEGIKKWIDYLNAVPPLMCPYLSAVPVCSGGENEDEEQKPSTSGFPNSLMAQTVNSMSAEYSEPMDLVPVCKDDISERSKCSTQEMAEISSDVSMDSSSHSDPDTSKVDTEQIAAFVDMFYLPFEHGRRGIHILQEFSWLHENSYVMKRSINGDSEMDQQVLFCYILKRFVERWSGRESYSCCFSPFDKADRVF